MSSETERESARVDREAITDEAARRTQGVVDSAETLRPQVNDGPKAEEAPLVKRIAERE